MRLKSLAPLLSGVLLMSALAGCSSSGGEANRAPAANLSVTAGGAPRSFVLDASKSLDPDGDALTYFWNWTIGTSTDRVANVTFPDSIGNATFPVTLKVTDPKGLFSAAFDKETIKLGNGQNSGPTPNVVPRARWVKPGETVGVDASLTTDFEGDPITYEWFYGPRSDFDPLKAGPVDPLKEKSTELVTFNTALLNPGQQVSAVFDKAGLYSFVCHPHPWMKGRLIVDDKRPADGDVIIDMKGYEFVNQTSVVGLGTNVTFRNLDADQHTASVTDYLPGSTPGGNGPVFEKALPDGEYVARLFAYDGKGGRSTASWGLKVSADAPDAAYEKSWTGDPNDVILATTPKRLDFEPPHDLGIQTAEFTWQDLAGQNPGNMTLLKTTNSTEAGERQCIAVPSPGKATMSPCLIVGALAGEKYTFVFSVSTLPAALWTMTLKGTLYPKAGFGDFNALRCHLHPGQPPHCF